MKNYINRICLALSIMLFFLYNMKESTIYFASGTLFAIPGVIGLFSKENTELKIFTIVVLLGSFINIAFTSYGIGGSIVFLVACGITYSCLKYLNIFFTISLFICLWLVAFLYYQMFVLGTVNGDIFLEYGLSKNYPGSMLVIFNSLWAVWKYLHYHKMPLLLPILSTIMAFFLDGRSSLICMVILTVFCFVVRGKKLTLLMAVIFVALLIHYWSSIIDLYELSTVSTRGLDTDRSLIWKAYFDNLDFTSILFGLDTPNLPVIKEWGGNPHNSFLSFHRRMGLIGLVALLYVILKGFLILIKRKQFPVLFFNVVLILRMYFDGMLTTGEDFFILTFFFLPLCYNNNVFQLEKQINSHGNRLYERVWDKFVFAI